MSTDKETFKRYLQQARDALLWKLDVVSERDARWPMTPTGTNLLGIVKHVASVEIGYFGDIFGRPSGEPLPWFSDDASDNPDNADMWATAEESRESIIALYHRSWAHSDRTIDELPLDAPGVVPWWPLESRDVTLHRILVHMIAETARHAGHADNSNLPDHDAEWWAEYVATLQTVAEVAAQ